jgi:predicted dehydrogenase
MLLNAEIDAVDICLPIMLHKPVIVDTVKAGKHVLVEKPMANTLEEAKQIVKLVKETGVTLMVAHQQRFSEQHSKMKELIESGKIGKIIYARADIYQNIRVVLPAGHWHYSHRGALISLGVHKLDMLRYFAGNIKRISGFHKTAMMPMVGQPGIKGEEADDLGVAAMEFENGALGTISASYCAVAHPWHDSIVLHGTQGCIHTIGGLYIKSEVDNSFRDFTKIKIAEDKRPLHDYLRLTSGYAGEIEHFLKCLLEGKEPLCSGQDNLYTMAAIEAIYLSGSTGRVVDVNSLIGEDIQ